MARIFPIFDEIEVKSFPKDLSVSRYNVDTRIFDGTYTYLPAFQRRFFESNPAEIIHVVEAGEAGRLDIIAHRFYKNSRLWWVIALLNPVKISNPFDLAAGTEIIIPPVEQIFGEVIL